MANISTMQKRVNSEGKTVDSSGMAKLYGVAKHLCAAQCLGTAEILMSMIRVEFFGGVGTKFGKFLGSGSARQAVAPRWWAPVKGVLTMCCTRW